MTARLALGRYPHGGAEAVFAALADACIDGLLAGPAVRDEAAFEAAVARITLELPKRYAAALAQMVACLVSAWEADRAADELTSPWSPNPWRTCAPSSGACSAPEPRRGSGRPGCPTCAATCRRWPGARRGSPTTRAVTCAASTRPARPRPCWPRGARVARGRSDGGGADAPDGPSAGRRVPRQPVRAAHPHRDARLGTPHREVPGRCARGRANLTGGEPQIASRSPSQAMHTASAAPEVSRPHVAANRPVRREIPAESPTMLVTPPIGAMTQARIPMIGTTDMSSATEPSVAPTTAALLRITITGRASTPSGP